LLIEFSKAAMFTHCRMRGGSLAILSGFYSSVNTEPDVDWFPDNGSLWLIIVGMISIVDCDTN
jgi:hypothetical protein